MSMTQPGNPEHLKASFWVACMEAQVWEMKECLAKNDFEHYLKELADCAGVAFDAIRLLSGKDAFYVIFSRFLENAWKFTPAALEAKPRDTKYYLDKIEKIKKELGVAE